MEKWSLRGGEHNIKYVENFLYLGSKSLAQTWRKICGQELPKLQCSNGSITYGCQIPLPQTSSYVDRSQQWPTPLKCGQHHERAGCLSPLVPQNYHEELIVGSHHQWRADEKGRTATVQFVRWEEKKIGWTCTPTAKRTSSKCGNSTFKENLIQMDVSWHNAMRVTSDQSRWRKTVAQCSIRKGRN